MTRVLIAEDNAVNRELLRELLEIGGYEVLEVCDGQQALNIIEQTARRTYCCLTLACQYWMAMVSYARIPQRIPILVTMPVLAITAYAMQGDREKIMQSGFNGYLSKPVDARSLATELKRLLSKRGDEIAPS